MLHRIDMAAAAAGPRRFHRLENITPESVDELFLHGNPPSHYQSKTPVFIFLIGAPGVGKTTQIKRLIKEEEKLKNVSYDHLYKISLDTIVEHTEPYRNATRKLYHKIKELQEKNGKQITNYNYAPAMSGIYITAIKSKNPDFTLGWAMNNAEIQKRAQKAIDKNADNNADNNATRKAANAANNTTRKAANAAITNLTNQLAKMNLGYTMTPEGRYLCTHCGKDFAGKTHMDKKTCQKTLKKGGSIKTVFDNDIINNAINKSYNILYDTTMDIKIDKKTGKLHEEDKQLPKIRNIMTMLEESPIPYKIYMIHVAVTHIANDNSKNISNKKIKHSIDTIKRRLHTRHQTMINEINSPNSGHLRAITPSNSLLKQFIIDNLRGFELMKKLYPHLEYIERENP